jgi:aspartate racemase
METQMFGKLRGAEVIMPTPGEIDTIADIYGRVVEETSASTEDFNTLRTLAHTLIQCEQLDGIILAGTDLAFVFNPANADFSDIDGARASTWKPLCGRSQTNSPAGGRHLS